MVNNIDASKLHFTYEMPTSASLQQGDLIRRSPDIEEVLRQVHPHFSEEKYRYFVILTQSCDLVLRDGDRCKASYISIAPVRSINDVARKVVGSVHYTELERRLQFASEDRKTKVVQAFERIFNNNEAPYFYFYQEPSLGLIEDCCAILSLSIAVRSDLHYQVLKDSRLLSLNSSFQHKLGYLVGTMYSRVGTQDWNEESNLPARAAQLIDRTKSISWIPKEIFSAVTKSLITKPNATREDLITAVQEAKRTKATKRDSVIKAMSDILASLEVEQRVVENFQRRLRSDPTIKAFLGQ